MENLEIYERVRQVPTSAQREIQAGRLKGKTDINPMWRIKALTEQFGPCGIGWKYTITDKRLENGANNEVSAFVDIDLYIKVDGEWSDAIPGTGGSAFVASERNGLYTSDECFKMALTDAISVACKALGFGADVYWAKDATKYTPRPERQQPNEAAGKPVCKDCGKPIYPVTHGGKSYSVAEIAENARKTYKAPLCWACMMARRKANESPTA
uniref:SsDNA annealing protein-like protein n=1 Tax=Siphoviridae sp. ctVCm11 TaxID=2826358 RepID=A0A8S5QLM8_9CAUD|nr:MAG TPA: ssDNA annealing protein-like protein [Siphoviridae sp. ctVCm11]